MLPTWVKVTKNCRWKEYNNKNIERKAKDIASGKTRHKKAQDRCKVIIDNYVSKIINSKKIYKKPKKILNVFRMLKKIFVGSRAYDDETDDEADGKTDKQPGTTDIPDLESR